MSSRAMESALSRWLSQGRGAAYLFVERNPPVAYKADLLRHCVRDYCSDYLFERGRYLHAIIQRTGRPKIYREHIVNAALRAKGFCRSDRRRQIALLEQLALAGDVVARRALYAASKLRSFASRQLRLELGEALARVDRLHGFLYMMREFPWRTEDQVVDLAMMLYQAKCSVEAVRNAVGEDAGTQRLLSKLEEREQGWQNCNSEARQSEPDLEAAARTVLESSDAEVLKRELRVFLRNKFPGPMKRLFELTRHADANVVLRATRALEYFEHPEVRRLGEKLLGIAGWQHTGVYLLSGNPKAGDWGLLKDVVTGQRRDSPFHDVGSAILYYSKKHRSQESERLLTLLYEQADCSFCRRDCVEHLEALGLQPQWMRDEFAHDAYTMADQTGFWVAVVNSENRYASEQNRERE